MKALVSYSLGQTYDRSPQTFEVDSGRADAKRTVRVVMQEYMRRDSLIPVLRLLFDLTFRRRRHRRCVRVRGLWAKDSWFKAAIAIARLFVIGHDACRQL